MLLSANLELFYAISSVTCLFLVSAVWNGVENDEESNAKEDAKERLSATVRILTGLVSTIIERRNEKKNNTEKRDDATEGEMARPLSQGTTENALDVPQSERSISSSMDEKADSCDNSTGEKTSQENVSEEENAPKKERDSSTNFSAKSNESVHSNKYWYADYWNFELPTEGELFAADQEEKDENDPDAWKKNEPEDKPELDASEGVDDKNVKDERGRFHGAFFKARNYPLDGDEKEEADDAPKRWRRKKNIEIGKNSGETHLPTEQKDEKADLPSSDASGEKWNSELNDREMDLLFNDFSGLDETDDDEQDATDRENQPFEFGTDYDYLEDESVPDDDKVDYLRRRVKEGDSESRQELAKFLIARAAGATREQRVSAFKDLDEAQDLLENDDENSDPQCFDDVKGALIARALLQRPVFFLRNGLKPPMDLANGALNKIRDWAENCPDPDAKRLLATAWQIRGNALLVSGGDSAALTSFERAKELFDDLIASGVEAVEPSVGFVCASLGEAYMAIGDAKMAVDSYREALRLFEKFADQELFLAEKVNVTNRLSAALRNLGEVEEADKALEEAIQAEERLLSYDEESYFAPLSHLLEVQADVLAQRGELANALVPLDRAVETLEKFLAYDSIMARRVVAYAHLENALRRRATIYLFQQRLLLAVRDIERAVDVLVLASKKDDAFDMLTQVIVDSCLVLDLCLWFNLTESVVEMRKLIRDLVDRLTVDERKRIAPIYAQLLLQRRLVYLKIGKKREAFAITNEAIKLLDSVYKEDDSLENQIILAKALVMRGFFHDREKNKAFVSTADLRRVKKLLIESYLADGLDDTMKTFLVDSIAKKAQAELSTGAVDVAKDDLRWCARITVAELRKKRWHFLDYLAVISRVSTDVAGKIDGAYTGLRVVHLWLSFANYLRRLFIESDWSTNEQGEESSQSKLFLQSIEAFIVDARRMRADLLEKSVWEPRFERYCDMNYSLFNDEPMTLLVEERPDDPLLKKMMDACRLSFFAKYREERVRFVREKLGNDLKLRAYFSDVDACKHVLRRRVANHEFALAAVLLELLKKTVDIMVEKNEVPLAVAEIREFERIFTDAFDGMAKKKEAPEDAFYWLNAALIGEMMGSVLGKMIVAFENEDKVKPTDNEEDRKLRDACLLDFYNEMEVTLRFALQAAERAANFDDASAKVHCGVAVASYVAWLIMRGRMDDVRKLIEREEKEFALRAENQSPIDLLAFSYLYHSLAKSALEFSNERDFAREMLLKEEKSIENEVKVVGKRALVAERLGTLYRELAAIEKENKNEDSYLNYLALAINFLGESFTKKRVLASNINQCAELLCRLLSDGGLKEGRFVLRYFFLIASRFDSFSKKTRAACAERLWDLSFGLLEWADLNRNCFYVAKKALEFMDVVVAYLDPNQNAHNVKMIGHYLAHIRFWTKFGAPRKAYDSLNNALDVLKRCNDEISSVEGVDPQIREMLLNNFHFQRLSVDVVKASLLFERLSGEERGEGSLKLDSATVRAELEKTVDDGVANIEVLPAFIEQSFPIGNKKVLAFQVFLRSLKQKYVNLLRKLGVGGDLLSGKNQSSENNNDQEIDNTSESNDATKTDETTKQVKNFEGVEKIWGFYYFLRVARFALEVDEKGYGPAAKLYRSELEEIDLRFGKISTPRMICDEFWSSVARRACAFKDAVRNAKNAVEVFRQVVGDNEVNDDFTLMGGELWANYIRVRLIQARKRDLKAIESELDALLQTTKRLFFEKKYFVARGLLQKVLYLQALLFTRQGRGLAAVAVAKKARSLCYKSANRGIFMVPADWLKKLNEIIADTNSCESTSIKKVAPVVIEQDKPEISSFVVKTNDMPDNVTPKNDVEKNGERTK